VLLVHLELIGLLVVGVVVLTRELMHLQLEDLVVDQGVHMLVLVMEVLPLPLQEVIRVQMLLLTPDLVVVVEPEILKAFLVVQVVPVSFSSHILHK
jgi:hypothetical protein